MFNLFINLLLTVILWQSSGGVLTNQLINKGIKIIKPSPQVTEITIAAEKAFVLSLDNRASFYSKNADLVQPIASITKLMTALVFIENNPGWDEIYTITKEDSVEGGRLNLFLGEKVKVKDVFATSLIASDNGATLALVHISGLTKEEFLKKMNEKARSLFLTKTNFFDPIGLSDANVSTAEEVAILAREALLQEEIVEVVGLKDYEFKTIDGRDKKIESTNYLLFDTEENNFSVLGAKTGYTEKAGYCFVGRFADKKGREIISVVLNSDGKNERFRESKNLINWVFTNYAW